MFYLYFAFQYFLVILLSPIRWSLNLVIRNLWESYKFRKDLFKQSDLSLDLLKEHAKKIHKNLKNNIENIKNRGDSAKFVSIWWVATKDPEVYDLLKSYISNGKFYRKPGQITKKSFSGDMLAGFIYALTEMWFSRKLDYDEQFRKKIINAFKSSLFQKPYLQIKSYSIHKDRGYLFRWFFANSGHFLPILAMLQILYRIEKKIRYKILYWSILPIAFVDITINPTFVIRKGKYRYVQWYYIHSNFLYYQSLYKLTGNKIFRYGMRFIYDRYNFNPEFTAFLGNPEEALIWLQDYISEKDNLNIKKLKVYNLKDLIRGRDAEYEEYEYIVPPRFRKNDYQWEKALDQAEWKDTPLAGIDFLHVLSKISKPR